MPSAVAESPATATRSPRTTWGAVFAVAAVFALVSAVRSFVPGVNEPHYLAKARHFWMPDWCRRDLFLDSANAHWFFYASVGWLAALFPFSVAAWLGRFAGWLTLGWGWQRLCATLGLSTRQSVAAATGFAAISTIGSLSGEWILGGVESKVFSYGLLFAGVSAGCRGQQLRSGVMLGLSVAFHPLVGGWGVIALILGELARLPGRSTRLPASHATDGPRFSQPQVQTIRHLAFPLVLLGACSSPGLLPAIGMLWNAPSPEVARQATTIQVYDRLDHHLLPARFSAWDRGQFLVETTSWLILGYLFARGQPDDNRKAWTRWRRFIGGSLAIAACGAIASQTSWQAGILKFYPFRLADGLLPGALALEVLRLISSLRGGRWATSGPNPGMSQEVPVVLATLVALLAALLWPAPDRVQPRWRPENRAAWIDACTWIRNSTPSESLFLTPRYSFGFKWWAERAEFAVWKDCPQDAASIVEWKGRLDQIQNWRTEHIESGFDRAAIQHLAEQTGIDYIVAWNVDPYDWKPAFRNSAFSIYHIQPMTGK